MATGFEIPMLRRHALGSTKAHPARDIAYSIASSRDRSGLGALSTYLEILGFIAEFSFMLWLLVKGVNSQRWSELAAHTRPG